MILKNIVFRGALISAGMNRLRMGIQSGSNQILRFYQRPSTANATRKSLSIISAYSKWMIPPAYDFIVDNPIETIKDQIDTLDLVYEIPQPFTLNVQALRIVPNTKLAEDFEKAGISHKSIKENYTVLEPTLINTLLLIDNGYPSSTHDLRFLKK